MKVRELREWKTSKKDNDVQISIIIILKPGQISWFSLYSDKVKGAG